MGGTGDGTKYTVHIELEAHDAVSAVVKKLAAEVEKAVNATQGIKGTPGGGGGGSGGEHPAKQIDRVKELSRAWGGLKTSFSGLFDPIRAAASAYSALSSVTGLSIGGVITGAVGINKSFEDMGLGMAAMLSSVDKGTSGPYAKFADAQTKVTGLMKLMREESVKSAIGLNEIGDSFQTIMPMARGLGVSLEDLVKLSTSTAIADPLGNVARGTTVRDIRQILGGHVSAREIQNPLLRGGIAEYQEAAHQYQELAKSGKVKEARDKQAEILLKIMKVLEQSPEAMAARRGSLSGRMAELKNLFEVGFMEGTKPAYEMLKSVLGDAAKWVSEHPEKIKQAAADFAKFLKGAATAVWDVFKWVYDNWGGVAYAIKMFVGIWATSKVLKFLFAIEAFTAALAGASFKQMGAAIVGGGGGMGAATGAAGGGIFSWLASKFNSGLLMLPPILREIAAGVTAVTSAVMVLWPKPAGAGEAGVIARRDATAGVKNPALRQDILGWFDKMDEVRNRELEKRDTVFGLGGLFSDGQEERAEAHRAAGYIVGPMPRANDPKYQIDMNINVKADGSVDATATSSGGNVKTNVRGTSTPTAVD